MSNPLDLSDLSKPLATVVITTRNRRDDLRAALASCLTQDVPLEIMVMDDASTDGTAEMVLGEFPSAALHRSDRASGYIVQRNRAAALVRTPILVSIDDDAIFTAPDIVRTTLGEFDHPRIGAVAIPVVNVNESPAVLQRAPDSNDIYAAAYFIGTAHALRLDLFRKLQGYHDFFYSQFEEQDYCLRLLDAGFVVRLGSASPIHHMQSPQRARWQIQVYGMRNQVLIVMLLFPWRFVLWSVASVAYQAIKSRRKGRSPLAMITGWVRGFLETPRYLAARKPVSVNTYRRLRAIAAHGGLMRLNELDSVAPGPIAEGLHHA